jgi:hypothetical protein
VLAPSKESTSVAEIGHTRQSIADTLWTYILV